MSRGTELLGLPGVGKSHVQELLAPEFGLKAVPIQVGVTAGKGRAISRGLLQSRDLVRVAAADVGKSRSVRAARRWLVLFERLGNRTPRELRDEGVLQAIWALMSEREVDNESINLLGCLCRSVALPSRVVFVSAPYDSHASFIRSRERKHRADVRSGSRERKWLAALLIRLRGCDEVQLTRHRNTFV